MGGCGLLNGPPPHVVRSQAADGPAETLSRKTPEALMDGPHLPPGDHARHQPRGKTILSDSPTGNRRRQAFNYAWDIAFFMLGQRLCNMAIR